MGETQPPTGGHIRVPPAMEGPCGDRDTHWGFGTDETQSPSHGRAVWGQGRPVGVWYGETQPLSGGYTQIPPAVEGPCGDRDAQWGYGTGCFIFVCGGSNNGCPVYSPQKVGTRFK